MLHHLLLGGLHLRQHRFDRLPRTHHFQQLVDLRVAGRRGVGKGCGQGEQGGKNDMLHRASSMKEPASSYGIGTRVNAVNERHW
ncbi:hypothetical protein J2X06_002821 [Lysobacter niastensis]|uniref:Uncharacterized protein n=1 Tax=Lysobacter niastensis TaxID=380629 RepID=A0ABU1WDC0_9GAMM|nr:hypothetical protein [Lysobacter niastensis]MDR7135612.1 hypothetical protein [Lysobacter niastensis]